MAEHVFLVAVTVTAPTRQLAETIIHGTLAVGRDEGRGSIDSPEVESWWIAEDDRHDGSDNDSAVFCRKGWQTEAFQTLALEGLTAWHNDPRRPG